eukprot:2728639-Amphidinium_carterae.1
MAFHSDPRILKGLGRRECWRMPKHLKSKKLFCLPCFPPLLQPFEVHVVHRKALNVKPLLGQYHRKYSPTNNYYSNNSQNR